MIIIITTVIKSLMLQKNVVKIVYKLYSDKNTYRKKKKKKEKY